MEQGARLHERSERKEFWSPPLGRWKYQRRLEVPSLHFSLIDNNYLEAKNSVLFVPANDNYTQVVPPVFVLFFQTLALGRTDGNCISDLLFGSYRATT